MKPQQEVSTGYQGDFFRTELSRMVNPKHPMVKVAAGMDWEAFETALEKTWHSELGRPGVSTRLMVSLQYLKYVHDLSDEGVLAMWVENPYWQHLSGMKFFEHQAPIEASSLSRWRKRLAEVGAEKLLEETLKAGLRMKLIQPRQLERINVDTTVQEKHVRFPTDTRLYERARAGLVRLAKRRGLKLRQSYERVGKQLMLKQSRYAHARQYKRAGKCTKKLKTFLGRVIRDIQRKSHEADKELSQHLKQAQRIYEQQRKDKGKVYSVHAPEVECISKGKAHKRYEFGVKVSVGTSSRGGWHVAAQAHPGNPYDGHTLKETLEQVRRMVGDRVKQVFVDKGYRGHGYEGEIEVHVDKQRKGKTAKRLWKWMKRRAVVEPGISHLKHGHRMNRNRLKGTQGDQLNAVLSAAGMNFRKLLKQAAKPWRYIRWMLKQAETQLHMLFNPNTAVQSRSPN
jgi:IS5 family transposase